MIEKNAAISPSKELAIESIIENALKIPGVKVNRKVFLSNTFVKLVDSVDELIELGPIESNCSQESLSRIASKLILTETSKSSAASFIAGIPGGLAMAASIPADTLQFFGMSLRLAQELSYLYGADDLWQDGEIDSERVCNQLILYFGVMFGVSGASSGVRLLSSQLAKQTLKKLPQKALTKTFWYPFVKQIGRFIGIKVTKESLAKGLSKAIPIVGGVISGGITFASMKPMGTRLAKTLEEANFGYSEEDFEADFEIVSEMARSEQFSEASDEDLPVEAKATEEDLFEKIEKLSKLKDLGAITEEEFQAKKTEILERI